MPPRVRQQPQGVSGAIQLIVRAIRLGITKATRVSRPYARAYLQGLLVLSILAVSLPFPFALVGVIAGEKWLIMIAGILLAFMTAVVAIWGSAIVLIVEALMRIVGAPVRAAERYVNLVRNILIAELGFTLFVGVVPVENNLKVLPFLVVAFALLVLIGGRGASAKRWVGKVLVVMVILLLFSIFFPNTSRRIGQAATKWDSETQVTATPTRGLMSSDIPPPSIGTSSEAVPAEGPVGKLLDIGQTEEFVLKPKTTNNTVMNGEGMRFMIWSPQNFSVVSTQPDGSKTYYEAPAGQSCWRGKSPYGALQLGATNEIKIQIKRVAPNGC